MKAPLAVDEFDLAGFFGCLPQQQDSDVCWEYNDCVYEASDSSVHISFAIAPAYRDVRVIVKVASAVVFECNAMSVENIQVHSAKGLTSLEILVTPFHSIWLTLKPQINIRQSANNEVAE